MKKIFKYLVPVLLLGLLSIVSCKDDAENMPRLFRPSFITTSCFAESNSITLAWRTSGEATSYSVELSRDTTFQSEPDKVQTVSNGKCVFTDLHYETVYYARVKADNKALGISSNWTELGSSIRTLTRVIPKILYALDGKLITESSATIEWAVSEQNLVDGVVLWQVKDGRKVGVEKRFDLSPTESITGKYVISNLEPRTTYHVTLINSKAQEDAERYNVQNFTTAGMPHEAVLVSDGLDLITQIKKGMEDESKSALVFQLINGVDYHLVPEGASDGNTGDIKLTKSIALLANPGERPTIYIRRGGFIVKAEAGNMPNIQSFVIENVNIKEPVSSAGSGGSKTYLLNIGKHNTGTDFTIDRFEIHNSDIVLPSTVLMMNDASEGVTTINHIQINNCLVSGVNDTKYVTKQFGFIHAVNKGSNIWNDVSVTNSTFYDFYISPGVFGVPTSNVPIPPSGKVSISNCTFYDWATSKSSYTAIGNFSNLATPLNLSITNCIFGHSAGKALVLGGCKLTEKNNYCTTEFEQISESGINMISLRVADSFFFKNAKEGDFTINDLSSSAYDQEYGDPRWIAIPPY